MKTVGVIIREFLVNGISHVGIRKDLFSAFDAMDVQVIGIPIYVSMDKIILMVQMCDGIVLSGGSHLLENDLILARYLYDHDIPVLGICLGMQTMVMAYNGKKEEKISDHQSAEEYVHEVIVDSNSKLFQILQSERIWVNSRHNWCVPISTFPVVAKSVDNIIEAIEDSTKKFFIGVQWHPESLTDDFSKKLFSSFVDSLGD